MSNRRRCQACMRWACPACGSCHLCEQLARTANAGNGVGPRSQPRKRRGADKESVRSPIATG